jgi:hypothetical protein
LAKIATQQNHPSLWPNANARACANCYEPTSKVINVKIGFPPRQFAWFWENGPDLTCSGAQAKRVYRSGAPPTDMLKFGTITSRAGAPRGKTRHACVALYATTVSPDPANGFV